MGLVQQEGAEIEHLTHAKFGPKAGSQSHRAVGMFGFFHVEQSSLTSGLGMVQAHGMLLASPPCASQGSAVQTAHSPVCAVAVKVDQAQVQLGWGWLEVSESCEGDPALSAGPCTEGGLIFKILSRWQDKVYPA